MYDAKLKQTIILNWFENEDNKDNNFEEDFIIRSDIASEEQF